MLYTIKVTMEKIIEANTETEAKKIAIESFQNKEIEGWVPTTSLNIIKERTHRKKMI